MKKLNYLAFLCLSLLFGCLPQKEQLIIFHAGSLSVPFKQIANEFERLNPNVDVILEAAGSRTCARKITDLNKPCDIMASADYLVIENLLLPKYANWNLQFATNEMVVAFNEDSKLSATINAKNWMEVLLDSDVSYGRSDPNSDPCGYRTVLVSKLAEIVYGKTDFSKELLEKDKEHIRPKEVDLLALLETGVIDYLFIYRSVAEQHNLNYISLSDSVNLRNPDFEHIYEQVSVNISGKKPGETIVHKGELMVYGITALNDAPNPLLAQKFLTFFFVEKHGLKIIEENKQPLHVRFTNNDCQFVPAYLQEVFQNQH